MDNSCAHELSGLRINSSTNSAIQSHRNSLRRRFGHVREGLERVQNTTVLDQAYTELYITEGQTQGLHTQHEVRQLEAQLRRNATSDCPIRVHDIFKTLSLDNKPIRVVLTSGVAGMGKTFSVWKFCLDWAKAVENQDLDLVVPLFFRNLNLVQHQKLSLLDVLRHFHPDLTNQSISETLTQRHILLILDGLDESRHPMDFTCEAISDIRTKAEVNTLLVNLLRGMLLPSALIWITSRPAATNQIPLRFVDRVTEVRGFFTDAQKEEFFSKRFTDAKQCKTVLSHIRASRSLYTMCQIPVFSCITAVVLDHMLETADTETGPLPQTLTHMYAHYLLVLTRRKYRAEKRGQDLTKADCETLLKLGKLAFEQLQNGNLMFYQEDLLQAGLDVTETSHLGVCTEIFQEESAIFDKSVYCFIHLSIQEFLAAVYRHRCFIDRNVKALLDEDDVNESDEESDIDLDECLVDFLYGALLQSFKSESGHLDLFVLFLHGLCLETNRKPLRYLLDSEWVRPGTIEKAQNQLKTLKKRFLCPNKGINLIHCLLEMNDNSVLQQIQPFLKSGDKSLELSEIQCSALAFLIQMSEEVLDELDFSQYKASTDARFRLIPAVKNCSTVRISECLLSKAHYEIIAAALASDQSPLRKLDLRGSWLQDSGLDTLSVGLNSTNCKLESLLLDNCRLTEDSCKMLAQVLERSRLKELDLSRNKIGDEGLQMLCSSLKLPQRELHTLSLTHCELTAESCLSLASVLSSSALTHLDLSYNPIQDSGLKLLSTILQRSRLQALRCRCCLLSADALHSLAPVLKETQLKELDLSLNKLGDQAVGPLRAILQGSHCLHTLRLKECELSAEGCDTLRLTLQTNPQNLTQLDLHLNQLQASFKHQKE
ncbi:NACHT, LRR and PYD domains-containing protein 12-like [Eucyclogobius newberryi]|uniref:NACHT, LRR and PYD domains-containing protein 12-like n=1 Tax=Eucyclogobius newberryi TaxID=166745 RepID=UPI003B5AADD1